MYRIHRDKITGRFGCVIMSNEDGSETSIGVNDRYWPAFLDWNAKQPVPLDLSDKEPEPPAVDREVEAIKVLLKRPEKDLALEELKGPLVRLLREWYGGM